MKLLLTTLIAFMALGAAAQDTTKSPFSKDTAGSISDAKAVTGPAKGGLREEAVNTFKWRRL